VPEPFFFIPRNPHWPAIRAAVQADPEAFCELGRIWAGEFLRGVTRGPEDPPALLRGTSLSDGLWRLSSAGLDRFESAAGRVAAALSTHDSCRGQDLTWELVAAGIQEWALKAPENRIPWPLALAVVHALPNDAATRDSTIGSVLAATGRFFDGPILSTDTYARGLLDEVRSWAAGRGSRRPDPGTLPPGCALRLDFLFGSPDRWRRHPLFPGCQSRNDGTTEWVLYRHPESLGEIASKSMDPALFRALVLPRILRTGRGDRAWLLYFTGGPRTAAEPRTPLAGDITETLPAQTVLHYVLESDGFRAGPFGGTGIEDASPALAWIDSSPDRLALPIADGPDAPTLAAHAAAAVAPEAMLPRIPDGLLTRPGPNGVTPLHHAAAAWALWTGRMNQEQGVFEDKLAGAGPAMKAVREAMRRSGASLDLGAGTPAGPLGTLLALSGVPEALDPGEITPETAALPVPDWSDVAGGYGGDFTKTTDSLWPRQCSTLGAVLLQQALGRVLGGPRNAGPDPWGLAMLDRLLSEELRGWLTAHQPTRPDLARDLYDWYANGENVPFHTPLEALAERDGLLELALKPFFPAPRKLSPEDCDGPEARLDRLLDLLVPVAAIKVRQAASDSRRLFADKPATVAESVLKVLCRAATAPSRGGMWVPEPPGLLRPGRAAAEWIRRCGPALPEGALKRGGNGLILAARAAGGPSDRSAAVPFLLDLRRKAILAAGLISSHPDGENDDEPIL
jgi:hypothetical protein